MSGAFLWVKLVTKPRLTFKLQQSEINILSFAANVSISELFGPVAKILFRCRRMGRKEDVLFREHTVVEAQAHAASRTANISNNFSTD